MITQRMKFHSFSLLFIIGTAVSAFHYYASAQIFDNPTTSRPNIPIDFRQGGGAYYNFSLEGGISVTVGLWGYVRNPGQYVVPSSTDVVGLISYGGGPLETAALSEVKLIRREMKSDSSFVDRVMVIDIERVTETGNRKAIPTLLPGDVVVVPGSGYNQWTTILGIVAQIIIVISGVISIIQFTKNK